MCVSGGESQKHDVKQKEEIIEDFIQCDTISIKFESKERLTDLQAKLASKTLNLLYLFKSNEKQHQRGLF